MSRWLMIGLLAVMAIGEASAQFVVQTGFSARFTSRRVSVGFFSSRVQTFGFYPVCPYPLILQPPVIVQPLIIVPPPVFVFVPPPLSPLELHPEPLVRVEPEVPFNDDRYIVIRPGGRPPIFGNGRPDPPALAQRANPGLPQPQVRLPVQEPPLADPVEEQKRQWMLALEAFTATQYGRTVERLEQLLRLNPKDAQAHFLMGQAYLALGKYPDAMRAIAVGLRLDPRWPESTFDPRELYGADKTPYLEQQALLREALRKRPDDPLLLFLLGYGEWWTGERDQARERFRKARTRTTQPESIDRFLEAGNGIIVGL